MTEFVPDILYRVVSELGRIEIDLLTLKWLAFLLVQVAGV